MINNYNLVIDTMSEVYNELKSYRDFEFWNFASHTPEPYSVYVLGRQQVVENIDKFKSMAHDPRYIMVFGNSAEGSDTLISQIKMLGLEELVLQKKVLLISGGDMEEKYPYILHDHFLCRVLAYPENQIQIQRTPEIFNKENKPYKFLFLNGRARPHRKYLWEKFNKSGTLNTALWTILDSRPTLTKHFYYQYNGTNLMATVTPIRHLPSDYEVDRYSKSTITDGPAERRFIKTDLFNNQWGEIYLKAEPYIDTYFSLVTETVFDYPYSFRTEKIAKPLAIGHPWICATGAGWYRDLQNLGFKTFNHLIDESFDNIDNSQDRMDRIVQVVEDLCSQDLASFLRECYTVCKYNQQHLAELAEKIPKEFPDRFFNFIQSYE